MLEDVRQCLLRNHSQIIIVEGLLFLFWNTFSSGRPEENLPTFYWTCSSEGDAIYNKEFDGTFSWIHELELKFNNNMKEARFT